VYCVKVLYGNVAEVLIEEILHHGQITRQSLISKTITKVEHNIKGIVDMISYKTCFYVFSLQIHFALLLSIFYM